MTTPVKWHDGPMVGFDTETTGPEPETARIVSAAIFSRDSGSRSWLVSVDVDIPEEATAIHGITTAQARAEGRPLATVIGEIASALVDAWERGPVVIFNASFDLTILQRELERVGFPLIKIGPVIDPLVLDKQMDRYRKGSRKLVDMAAHYAVKAGDPHNAAGDAITATRLAWRLATRFPTLQRDIRHLHGEQIRWAREQRAGLEDYMRRTDPKANVDRGWPVLSSLCQEGIA